MEEEGLGRTLDVWGSDSEVLLCSGKRLRERVARACQWYMSPMVHVPMVHVCYGTWRCEWGQ